MSTEHPRMPVGGVELFQTVASDERNVPVRVRQTLFHRRFNDIAIFMQGLHQETDGDWTMCICFVLKNGDKRHDSGTAHVAERKGSGNRRVWMNVVNDHV